jgi:hypothetical protein
MEALAGAREDQVEACLEDGRLIDLDVVGAAREPSTAGAQRSLETGGRRPLESTSRTRLGARP